ncbi:Catechol O-methyltransferase domain-containing protein 1 [Pseudolycoriella hygida]|uniref:Catechol O-methyltransferase domain-containing protein 1 n=1 Tax=Pseudolycoriella hygida TaxID=35572 RepID=A0A9Q0N1L7_9DIPT|nr:Catechol O-methyltransferase domain-containing protein 1 [Pseudolycoriella hygida]
MSKSYESFNPRTQYCLDHSTPLNKHVDELMEVSLACKSGQMTGAKGVLQTCATLIEIIQAKNILDIGFFTGVSALTWATIIPEDGKVISMDVDDAPYKIVGKPHIDASGVGHKIDIRIQPALKTLQELIDAGQSGKFDFAFLDASKTEYPSYLASCLQLVRTGGIIAVDNALWDDRVLEKEKDTSTAGVDTLNKMALSNSNVQNVLLPIEDGLHLIVKKC